MAAATLTRRAMSRFVVDTTATPRTRVRAASGRVRRFSTKTYFLVMVVATWTLMMLEDFCAAVSEVQRGEMLSVRCCRNGDGKGPGSKDFLCVTCGVMSTCFTCSVICL